GTGAALLGALRDGDLVALQVDRPSAGGKNARVELFDRPLDLPLGPIALARAAGALMIPVFVYRTGRSRYRIRFRAAIRIDSESDLEVQAQRVAREVEWAIRQEPHQWFCFHSLWP
ncbi:MAG TPA: lysophospholipid acyltransferase family protein, partial [Planctomycetota bacterium]